MKYGILWLFILLAAFPMNTFCHEDEKDKPKKVSSATMQEENPQAAEDKVAERDFELIRAEVQSSTTFIVIKALSLAIAIIGLGAVYLPRKRIKKQ